MERRYSNPSSILANYDELFEGREPPPQDGPIPKVAHFVYTRGDELTWLEWLAVRAAFENLGVEKAKIWLPEGVQTEGEIWKKVEGMDNVSMHRIVMPETVYDHDIPRGFQADVARLKIIYEEGGIYLERDLVALRSSDDVFNSTSTRSTVMARRLDQANIPNWLIMTKPGSPFLKRWMLMYKGAWEDGDWKKLALETPRILENDLDEDLTVLDGYSWFYPLASNGDGDATLKKLWFGKSWEEIDRSYGTHVWHWDRHFRELVTPEIVRSIDTPLFCKLRKLFNDLDGDGYYAVPPENDANCSVATMAMLQSKSHGMFSDYRMDNSDGTTKLVDSSGYNHHGWAPEGTQLMHEGDITYWNVKVDEYAVLPVPTGWDSRQWSARLDLQLEAGIIDQPELVGLFKIRTEGDGEIAVSVGRHGPAGLALDLEWREEGLSVEPRSEESEGNHEEDNVRWIPARALISLEETWHELFITFDRREVGMVHLFLDGSELGSQQLPLLDSVKIGQDIWINALEWDQLDSGFRGKLRRLTMYANALSADDIKQDIPSTATGSSVGSVHLDVSVTKSQGSMLLAVVGSILLMLFAVRGRKTLVRNLASYIRHAIRKVRRISEDGFRS